MKSVKLILVLFFQLSLLNFLFGQKSEVWSEIKLENNPVGYLNIVSDYKVNKTETSINMKLTLNRLNNKLEMSTSAHYKEDQNGKIISVSNETKLSSQTTKLNAERNGNKLNILTTSGGKEYTSELTFNGSLIGPEKIKQLTLENLKSENDSIRFQTFLPDFNKISTIKRTLYKIENDFLYVKEETPGLPINFLIINKKGITIETKSQTPFGMSVTRISERDKAIIAANGTILPDEIFDKTLIRSNVRLADARSVDEMVIKITAKNKDLGLPELGFENQQVIEKTDEYVVLKINRPSPKDISNHQSQILLSEFLEPNSIINSDNSDIVNVASQYTNNNSLKKCYALKNWVTTNMNFDLGIVMAPASEIIKNKKGTCSEYATLLTSLYRASNIPSRVAMGFVYMSGIWGGHAWSEVFINGQWIPFDAAINGKGIADAARFKFVTSSLKQGAGALNGKEGVQMYGNAEVTILSYKSGGKEIKVTESKAYRIENQKYTNKGLNLEVYLSKGYSFLDSDKVWPNPHFLSIKGPNNSKITFSQRMILPTQKNKNVVKDSLHKLTNEKVNNKNDIYYSKSENIHVTAILKGSEYILIKYEGENIEEDMKKIKVRFKERGI